MFVSSEIAIVFLGLIVVTVTQPLENEVKLLKYHDDRSSDGSYDFQ